jgi:hypothetical protein
MGEHFNAAARPLARNKYLAEPAVWKISGGRDEFHAAVLERARRASAPIGQAFAPVHRRPRSISFSRNDKLFQAALCEAERSGPAIGPMALVRANPNLKARVRLGLVLKIIAESRVRL